jgi:hypothetical protein
MTTELDHLRAFRAAAAAPDDEARAAARARLLEEIAAAAPPTAQTAPPTAHDAPPIAHDAPPIAHDAPPIAHDAPRPAHAAPARRRPRLLAGLGGLALAGAAAVAVAIASGLGGGDVAPTPATAAALLREAADGAAAQPYVPLRPGQYWYTKQTGTISVSSGRADGRGPSPSVYVPTTSEEWTAYRGWGRTRSVMGKRILFPTPTAKRDWIAMGRRWAGEVTDMRVAPQRAPVDSLDDPGQLSPRALRALPTDPEKLYERIAAVALRRKRQTRASLTRRDEAELMWMIAVGLIAQGTAPTPPALRAAAYEVLARIPFVESRGRAQDALGRPGSVVAFETRGVRVELLIDPATGTLLEQRHVLTRDNYSYTEDWRPIPRSRVPAGWSSHVTYVVAGIVDSTRERLPTHR